MHDDRLVPLESLPDFHVSDGYTDIRGFDAFLPDGRRVGRVDDLLVDPGARRVAAVTLDAEGAMAAPGTRVPIEEVEIDTPMRRVLIQGPGAERLGMAGSAASAALMDEDVTLPAFRPQDAAEGDDERRMTLAEEELAVFKDRVSAGSVDVHKRVETRHVRENVPVMHEEVTVERRPVTNPDASTEVRYEGDTIYVPIVEEELVVQKRTVVREELVIHRKQVERTQVVEADLRRERAEVREPGEGDASLHADDPLRGGRDLDGDGVR